MLVVGYGGFDSVTDYDSGAERASRTTIGNNSGDQEGTGFREAPKYCCSAYSGGVRRSQATSRGGDGREESFCRLAAWSAAPQQLSIQDADFAFSWSGSAFPQAVCLCLSFLIYANG